MDSVSKLVLELAKLPGVGEKTATRLAYHILRQPAEYSQNLAHALLNAKEKTGLCPTCMAFSDQQPCRICADPSRDRGAICVVEKPSDILPLEQAGATRGLYHVLHGVLSPLDGIGPEELRVRELLARLSGVREVVLATNPTVEGDATALYLQRLISPQGIRVTQLAHGIPFGGRLEFTDRATIQKAFTNRTEMTA
jgi:recombination protein RecR